MPNDERARQLLDEVTGSASSDLRMRGVDTANPSPRDLVEGSLTAAEVESLEAQARERPDDLAARVRLLTHFASRRHAGEHPKHRTSARRFEEQYVWFVRHRPALTLLFLTHPAWPALE